jgi:transposase
LLVRRRLVGMRTQAINVVRALCEREGIQIPGCHPETFDDALEGLQLDAILFETIAPALEQIVALNRQIKAMDAELEAVAKAHPVATILRTVRGVGVLTSLAFIAVVDDPKRFGSARELTSYIGLVPSEHNSGDSKHQPGAITKTGDPTLRGYLYEAALTVVKKTSPESHLKNWYTRLSTRSNARGTKRKALVAVARRLARILFAMWRDNKSFDEARTAPVSPTAAGAQAA